LSSYAFFFLILFIPNSSPNPNSSLLQFSLFPNDSSYHHRRRRLLDSLNSSLLSNQVLEIGEFSVHQLSNLLRAKSVSMPIYALQWKIMV
jgi:hypothetical protein